MHTKNSFLEDIRDMHLDQLRLNEKELELELRKEIVWHQLQTNAAAPKKGEQKNHNIAILKWKICNIKQEISKRR